MIQCQDCEFFRPDALGNPGFACDPFRNIKEEACLQKWQIIKLDRLLASQESSSSFQRRIAPLQEKMFKLVSREVAELEEGESWRQGYEEPESESDDDENESGYFGSGNEFGQRDGEF